MNNLNHAVIHARGLSKTYEQGPVPVQVLNDISFSLQAKERLAIMGSSGSGKSTLLNLLGGLDLPDHGDVQVMGESLACLDGDARGRLRNRHLGFVYQFHHLLGEFSAQENVMMPLLIAGEKRHKAQQRAASMLTSVGLKHRLGHKPAALSGGERQRVAIARAIVTSPACVLMDEPTGNLDVDTAGHIEALLWRLNQDMGLSLIIVTHDPQLASRMDRTLYLHEGRLQTLADSPC